MYFLVWWMRPFWLKWGHCRQKSIQIQIPVQILWVPSRTPGRMHSIIMKKQLVTLDIFVTFERFWHEGHLSKLPTFGFHLALVSRISYLLGMRIDGIHLCRFLGKMMYPRVAYLWPFSSFYWWRLISTTNLLHWFFVGNTLHCSRSYRAARLAAVNIDHGRIVLI